MITLHTSANARDLVATLAADLRADRRDPFSPTVIVVPNRAVERWLRHQLATHLDVLANVTFPELRGALDAAVAAVFAPASARDRPWWLAPDDDGPDWSAAGLRSPILERLRAHATDPDFASLNRYLYGDRGVPAAVSHRELTLSAELAAVIARLARDRSDDALAWARAPTATTSNAPIPAPWLRRLVAELDLTDDRSPARQRERLAELSHRDGGPVTGPPLRLFGAPALSPADHRALTAVARHLPVRWYRPTPAPRAWAASPPPAAFTNPVLAHLGRAELTARAASPAPQHHETPAPTPAKKLLARMQGWVLADRPTPPTAACPRDDTLSFHRTYGPQRQVEVLRDLLLSWFADDRDLEPRDVLILTPDVSTFAPLVAAVFAQRGGATGPDRAPAIPVHIADLGLAATNPLADVLLALLELASERVTASRLAALVSAWPVAARFDLDAAAVADLRTLIADSGLRWGLDATDRAAAGQPPLTQNTVAFGLERLAFGALMPDADPEVTAAHPDADPLVPLALDGRERADRAAALIQLSRAVADARARLNDPARPRTAAAWRAEFNALVSDITAVPDTQAWLLRDLDDALADALGADPDGLPISLRAVTRLLAGRFTIAQSGDRHITGAVTLSELRPGRTLPYKVIALLGMDDGAFPRAPRRRAWDPFATLQPGETDPRDVDRLLLLETLMAAESRCAILWSGFDIKKGAELPACVPVEELLAVVAGLTGEKPQAIATDHPLQPWSPRTFAHAPTTFDATVARAAQALAKARRDPAAAPLIGLAASRDDTLSDEESPPTDLGLDELARDLANAAKLFLYQRLDVYLAEGEPPIADREPLELDHLTRWKIADEAARILANGDVGAGATTAEQVLRRFAGQGALPLRAGGARVAAQLADEAQAILTAYDAWSGVVVARGPIALEVDGLSLGGGPDRVRERDGELILEWVTASTLSGAKRRLTVWVTVLAASAAGWPVVAGRMVGRKANSPPDELLLRAPSQAEAQELLADLVAIWRLGRNKPLRLFPKTSAELASQYPVGAPTNEDAPALRAKLAQAARDAWEVDPAGGKWGDLNDRWIAALFGDYDPGEDLGDVVNPPRDGLLDLALRVFGPMEGAVVTKPKGKGQTDDGFDAWRGGAA